MRDPIIISHDLYGNDFNVIDVISGIFKGTVILRNYVCCECQRGISSQCAKLAPLTVNNQEILKIFYSKGAPTMPFTVGIYIGLTKYRGFRRHVGVTGEDDLCCTKHESFHRKNQTKNCIKCKPL